VAGFPNLFTLVGPNTGVGNTSLIYMIESQLNYLLDALRAMGRHQLATVEVHPRAQERYNQRLQRRMVRTVWSSGCASWYQDSNGRNTTLWPGFAVHYRAITRHFDLDAYRVTLRTGGITAAV
jgi:cyclohexanone monooxygenase